MPQLVSSLRRILRIRLQRLALENARFAFESKYVMSSARNILDIRRKNLGEKRSRARAQLRMTPLFSERQPRLRARRRKLKLVATLAAIVLGAGAVGGAGYASHTVRLTINDIVVSGVQALSADDVRAKAAETLSGSYFNLFSKRNIFLYPQSALESELASQFPRIETVTVSRAALLAQAITVSIQEREVFALWCEEATCFALDRTGFIFAPHEPRDDLMVFKGGLVFGEEPIGQFVLRGRFADTAQVLSALLNAGFTPHEIRIENDKDFSVLLKEGFVMRLSFESEKEEIVRNAQLALQADAVRGRESELDYIDLRFENKVYYRFKE